MYFNSQPEDGQQFSSSNSFFNHPLLSFSDQTEIPVNQYTEQNRFSRVLKFLKSHFNKIFFSNTNSFNTDLSNHSFLDDTLINLPTDDQNNSISYSFSKLLHELLNASYNKTPFNKTVFKNTSLELTEYLNTNLSPKGSQALTNSISTSNDSHEITNLFNLDNSQNILFPQLKDNESLSILKNFPVKNIYYIIDIHNGICQYKNYGTQELLKSINNFPLTFSKSIDPRLPHFKASELRKFISIQTTLHPLFKCYNRCLVFALPPFRFIILRFRILFIFITSDVLDRSTNWLFEKDIESGNLFALNFKKIFESCLKLSPAIDAFEKPFELIVLEIISSQLCFLTYSKLQQIQKVSEEIISSIFKNNSGSNRLLEITKLKKTLDNITDFTKSHDEILLSLINSEEILQNISYYWGQFYKKLNDEEVSNLLDKESSYNIKSINKNNISTNTFFTTINNVDNLIDKMDFMRDTLEPHEQEISILHKRMHREQEDIEYALQLTELHMSSVRNTLLKSDLGLNILDVTFGFLAAITGIFGMNLVSGYEQTKGVFWPLTFFLFVMVIISLIVVAFLIKKIKL